jgi:hypothetical protein
MTIAILPETDTPIKALRSDRDTSESISDRASIVIRISPSGQSSIQIIAEHSEECDQLNERLETARPLIEVIEAIVSGDR